LVDNINDLLVSEELFDDLLLRRDTNEPLVYYSLSKSTNKPDISAEDLLKITENSANSLNNAMNQLQYGGEAFSASRDRLQTIYNELVDNSVTEVRDASMLEVMTI